MPDKWTGEVVGKMHCNKITYDALADKLGYTKAYVSMVLNGARQPKGAEEKFRAAVDDLAKGTEIV